MFNMQECKPVKVPIPVDVKLSVDQCPKTHEEEEHMSHVPYASVFGSLIGHCTFSGSFEQVYVKTREGALDNSKKSFQVFAWHC